MIKLAVFAGIFHPDSGGPATYLREVLPQFQARGAQVRAITYSDTPTVPHSYPYPLTRIVRRALPLRVLEYARAARELLAWGDLAFVHDLDLPLVGRRVPRVLKVVGDTAWERAVRKGWVAPEMDIDAFQTAPLSAAAAFQRWMRSQRARTFDAILVPSEYLKRMVVRWGVSEARVTVIYNALPPDAQAVTLSQKEARMQLGLLLDHALLVTVGRLVRWKGIDHLIAALRRVPQARLLIVGDGPDRQRLTALAADLGSRVTFWGAVPRDRVALALRAADYKVLYSGYEGLSHVLLESLNAGTPVIASDKGGNPEVVQHNVNGLLVPYVDVDALAQTLHSALQTGERARLAANTALNMERFHFEAMIDQTWTFLQGMVR